MEADPFAESRGGMVGWCGERWHLRLMVTVRVPGSIISRMAALRVSESEAIRELPRLLAQVEQGDEVIIERGDQPFAVLVKAKPAKRSFDETVRQLRESARLNLDDAFAGDVQAAINAHREPHNYPPWD